MLVYVPCSPSVCLHPFAPVVPRALHANLPYLAMLRDSAYVVISLPLIGWLVFLF